MLLNEFERRGHHTRLTNSCDDLRLLETHNGLKQLNCSKLHLSKGQDSVLIKCGLDWLQRLLVENSLDMGNHLNKEVNDDCVISILRLFVILITHLIYYDVIIVSAAPTIIIDGLFLTVIELLDKAGNKSLSYEAIFFACLICTGFDTFESNIKHLLHIGALSKDREKLLLLHDIL